MEYKVSYKMEELIPIVAELAEQYGGYESTSITYEKAQQFLGAVCYCIQEYERENNSPNPPDTGVLRVAESKMSAREAYLHGRRLVIEKVKAMRERYHMLLADFTAYGNRCLDDTIRKGIPEFLKWYDPKYHPQDTILTLDYPVLEDLSAYEGIDRVYRYVEDIWLEQQFLAKFDSRTVEDALARYCTEYEEMIENLCGIMLADLARRMWKPEEQFNTYHWDREKIRVILEYVTEQHCTENPAIARYLRCGLQNFPVLGQGKSQFGTG